MPIINGVTFYEAPDSCTLRGGVISPLEGTRILRCAWADRLRAVSALLGQIIIIRDAATGEDTRQVLFSPDTFPGWDNLEAIDFQMTPLGAISEDSADSSASYTWAVFTVQYKVPDYLQDADTGSNENAQQFYESETTDYESQYVLIPRGSVKIGGEKALDAQTEHLTITIRTFTKRDLATRPDFSTWLDTVNDAQFPPDTGAAAGCLRFAGAKLVKKVSATGQVRYDATIIFKERDQPWNYGIKPSDGTWAEITPNPFNLADYTQIAGL